MVEMLPDLLIAGFRAFKHLEIEKLGRVNLITGKNNSGKSCLLEALRLYGSGGSPAVMAELLQMRDEIAEPAKDLEFHAMLSLLHGRKTPNDIDPGRLVEIGPRKGFPSLSIDLERSEETLLMVRSAETQSEFRLDRPLDFRPYWHEFLKTVYVGPNGLSEANLEGMWDSIALTDLEDTLIECLRLVAPEVERVSLLAPAPGKRRIAFVRVHGSDRPLPLRSLGDGMNRLFGIALAMVNAKDGLLLVDEIENGVHYSVQPKLWHFIFQLAKRLNVQVFATTHSWDCITAFQQAAREPGSDGMLIRLDWRDGSVRTTEFTEHDLAIATRETIEVR